MRHALVLTAAAGIGDAVVESVEAELADRAVMAGEPLRLGPTAVEIPVTWPAGQDPRPLLNGAPVDANVVSLAGRQKRLLLADMDSTIIGVECVDELADFAGVKPQVAAITERAMRGELDFEAALVERVALLKGLPATVLQECYDARVRLNPGARALVRTMAALGAATALISGGFSFFTERVAAEAGFGWQHGNTLVVEDGRLTGEVARPILGRQAKLETLITLATGSGFTPELAVAVGDGANDVDMVREAGMGVSYHGKPALAAAAGARLDHSDLTALLALQGIPQAAWSPDQA